MKEREQRSDDSQGPRVWTGAAALVNPMMRVELKQPLAPQDVVVFKYVGIKVTVEAPGVGRGGVG